MIKKLHLKNFQGHKDSLLELGPGINTIIGENDQGKTSVFRSVDWVRRNRPLGDGVIRKGQESPASVLLETSSCAITKEKGTKVNSYLLSGVEEPYTSFGQNPPEDIVEALNLHEINIQSQLDQPFLVLSSPGQVAQHIRSISGLDVVDKVSSLLKSKTSEKKSLLNSKKEELKETEEKLSILEKVDVVKLEQLITEAEELQEENRELDSSESKLESIISEYVELEKIQINLPDDVDASIEKSESVILDLQAGESSYNALSELVEELETTERELSNLPTINKSLLEKIEPTINQYNNIEGKINVLEEVISNCQNVEEEEKGIEERMEKELEVLFSLLSELTECPYCGNRLNDDSKELLIGNS